MARKNRRGSGAKNRSTKSRTSRTTSTRSKNTRGSGARNNRSTTKSTSTKSTKSTSPSGNKRGSGKSGQGTPGGGQKTNPTKKSRGLFGNKGSGGLTIGSSKKQSRFSSFSKRLRNLFSRKPKTTQQQVNKDNQMYGNTVPAGAFDISKAGKIQAKENKLAAAQRQAAAVRQREQARKAGATGVRQVYGEAPGFTQPKKDAYNFSKGVSNLSASFTSPAVQNWAGTSFDKASSWYNKGRLPNEGKMSIRNLLRNDLSQQQQIGKFNPNRKLNWASYARGESNPFRGMPGYGTITGQGQVEGGFQTGPTPSVRQAIERPLKAAMNIGKFVVNPKVAILGSLLKPTPLADGTLRGKPGFETQAGGLNIGSGSNMSSGSDAVRNSRTARKLSSISNRSKRNQNLLASAEGWGLRPDGVTGAYKEGQIFNTGGKSGKDYIYKGTPGKGSFVPLATTPPVPLATASPDASNVQGYINQLSIYGMDPNYMPQFQFSRRGQASGRAYRNAWNRNNFKTTV